MLQGKVRLGKLDFEDDATKYWVLFCFLYKISTIFYTRGSVGN